jgi:nicotinamide-nucleotide amidase
MVDPSVISDAALHGLAHSLGEKLRARGLKLTAAESCTGGLIAKVITDVAGSSIWFDCGLVAYGYGIKERLLGVDHQLLMTRGAVSLEVVDQMAKGVLKLAQADLAVAVSGIAGPSGGLPDKPVGTVCVAWLKLGQPIRLERAWFAGNRDEVRRQTARLAFEGLLDLTG